MEFVTPYKHLEEYQNNTIKTF